MASRRNLQSQFTHHSVKSTIAEFGSLSKTEKRFHLSTYHRTMFQVHWQAIVLLFLLLSPMKSNVANPVKPHHISRNLNEELIKSICLGPNKDTTVPHEAFRNASAGANQLNDSLNFLHSSLVWIKQKVIEYSLKNKLNLHFDHANSLENLKFPEERTNEIETEHLPGYVLKVSSEYLMPYLNELENIRLNMLNKTMLGNNFENLTEIQGHLELWLQALHQKMLQHSMTINCDKLRHVMLQPYKKEEKNMKEYIFLTFQKLENLMGIFDNLFNRTLTTIAHEHHRNSLQKKASEVANEARLAHRFAKRANFNRRQRRHRIRSSISSHSLY